MFGICWKPWPWWGFQVTCVRFRYLGYLTLYLRCVCSESSSLLCGKWHGLTLNSSSFFTNIVSWKQCISRVQHQNLGQLSNRMSVTDFHLPRWHFNLPRWIILFSIKFSEKPIYHHGWVNIFLICPQTNSTYLGRADECCWRILCEIYWHLPSKMTRQSHR